MILLVNGWPPDIVADMSQRLNAPVRRVADCTWIKTNDKATTQQTQEEKA